MYPLWAFSAGHCWYKATQYRIKHRRHTTHVHYHIFHKIQIFQTLRPCESLAIQTGMVREEEREGEGKGTAEKKRCNNRKTATFSSARTLSFLRKDNIRASVERIDPFLESEREPNLPSDFAMRDIPININGYTAGILSGLQRTIG